MSQPPVCRSTTPFNSNANEPGIQIEKTRKTNLDQKMSMIPGHSNDLDLDFISEVIQCYLRTHWFVKMVSEMGHWTDFLKQWKHTVDWSGQPSILPLGLVLPVSARVNKQMEQTSGNTEGIYITRLHVYKDDSLFKWWHCDQSHSVCWSNYWAAFRLTPNCCSNK